MRISSVFAVTLIMLGCQSNKGTSDDVSPGATDEAPEIAVEVEAAPEPEVATEDSPDDGAEPEAPADDPLVERVKGLLQIKTVARTDNGVLARYVLEVSPAIDENSPPQAVSDAMMFATFYAAPVVYRNLPDLDGLEQLFIYQNKIVGRIKMTRASYESLNYDRGTNDIADLKVRRRTYRELLAKLPKGAVDIKKKYRP